MGVASLLLSAGVACTQLFGDPQQNTLSGRQGPSFGATPASSAPLLPGQAAPGEPGLCSPGQLRCEGALLQTCSDDLSTWITVQRCAAAALCQADPAQPGGASCLPAACAAEEMTCNGAVLQKCSADRTGWDVFNTCLSPAHCNANLRQCLPEPCSPGDRRCDRSQTDQAPVLEVCRDDRSGWDQLDACVTRELCDQTLTSVGLGGLAVGSDGMVQLQPSADPSTVVQCNLPACAAGESRCEGARLQYCSEGRTGWLTAEECASEALCQLSVANLGASGAPQCVPPACAAGEHRCSEGGLLQVCSADRSGFVDEQQCIGAPFCNAALANQGQSGCTDAPCEAGLMQCNGAQIEVCRDDRTGLDPVGEPCESAALCNAEDPANAFCEEPLCRRGPTSGDEFRCEGAQLQRCNESLTVYDTLQTCVTPALCDASQRLQGCRPPVCQPGQFSCTNGFLQTCNADQTGFQNVENCGSQAQCDANAGRCADPCEPGSTRCNASNGDLERCNDRLTGWQPIADCPNAQLCDAQAGRCRICVPNDFSCADGQLRQCAADGLSFSRVNIPPECALAPNGGGGIRACQGNTVVVNPCPLGCQQPENRCRECNPGQTQCVGNGQLRTCGNNGFYGAPTSCSDGNFCNGTETCQNNQCVGGAPPNCNGFGCQQNRCNNCNGGQCASGTQFMTCDNGLLSAPRNCPTNQVCQGGGNCLFNCAALNCNDNNSCTNDSCSPTAGCQRSNVPNRDQCVNGDIQSCTNGVFNNQDCGANGCNPGSTFCNACNANTPATCQNGQRRVCVNGQFQNQSCPQGQQCQNGACVNVQVCTPLQQTCAGNNRQVCNAQGTGFTTNAPCPAPTNICSGGQCVECRNNADCGAGRTCNAFNRCISFCTPGSFNACAANGQSFTRCNAAGSAFNEVVNCGAGQTCSAAQQGCVTTLVPGVPVGGGLGGGGSCGIGQTFLSCNGTTLSCVLGDDRIVTSQCPAGTSCNGQRCQ